MTSILVTIAAHYIRGPDDHVYAMDPGSDYQFWSRYLMVFDRVGVAARVAKVQSVPGTLLRADGPGVEFHDLPDYLGPWQYLRHRWDLVGRLREAIARCDAFCLRVACPIGALAWRELRRRGCPFGVEVVADPWDALAPGAVKSIVRPLARWSVARGLKAQCRTAAASAYVTRRALQRRYPPAPDTFTTHYSSIELPAETFIDQPRSDYRCPHRLVFVGTLAVLYKAPDVLIRALAHIGRPALHLTIVGDGRERSRLEALAAALGVDGKISFAGRLPPGKPVRDVLDASDLFVLPSRQEGLPRAMIEAMARGLPCIGSTVGGIPELLDTEWMVPPDDVSALAAKIAGALQEPDRLRAAATRNLDSARQYVAEILQARRAEFYRAIRAASIRR